MSGDASMSIVAAFTAIGCLAGALSGDDAVAGKCASTTCFAISVVCLGWATGSLRRFFRRRNPARFRIVRYAMVDVDTGRVVPESVSGWPEQTFTASQDTRESLAKAHAECKAAAYSAHCSVVPPVVPANIPQHVIDAVKEAAEKRTGSVLMELLVHALYIALGAGLFIAIKLLKQGGAK